MPYLEGMNATLNIDRGIAALEIIATGSDAIRDRIAELEAKAWAAVKANADSFDPLALLMGTTPAKATSDDDVELAALAAALPGVLAAEREANACPKCGGTGKLDAYRHIQGGLCFRCNGTGCRNNG
jgi:hypothetical protein